MSSVAAPLLHLFKEERDALNERFKLRLRSGARIDAAAFLLHVNEVIIPLLMPINAALPERTRGALVQLYDASLDLFAAAQLGPDASAPWASRVWKELLPLVAPRLLALHPQQVAGCLSNAAVQIARQAGARPQDWLHAMQRSAPQCATVSELLDAGKVAAWMAGMVQYRQAALQTATKLPVSVACATLGITTELNAAAVAEVLLRLRDNVWLTVAESSQPSQKSGLRLVMIAGAFVGFGGLFRRPPVVSRVAERFVATDHEQTWQMYADAFGVWFRRINDDAFSMKAVRTSPEIKIDDKGTLSWGKLSLKSPELAKPTSIACDEQTAAITIPTSHHVFLYSRLGSTV